MIVRIMHQGWQPKLKLVMRIAVLAILLCYVLPGLVAVIWKMNFPGPGIRHDQRIESPMRVTNDRVHV